MYERQSVLAAQYNGLVGKFTRQLGLAAAVAVAAHVGGQITYDVHTDVGCVDFTL